MATYRTEQEILADPATTPGMRQRIEADQYGRALFDGLRRHHKPALGDPPPRWDEMTSFERGWVWRPAIYDMLETMGIHKREDA